MCFILTLNFNNSILLADKNIFHLYNILNPNTHPIDRHIILTDRYNRCITVPASCCRCCDSHNYQPLQFKSDYGPTRHTTTAPSCCCNAKSSQF